MQVSRFARAPAARALGFGRESAKRSKQGHGADPLAIAIAANRSSAVSSLRRDHFLDLGVKRGVRAEDELAQHRDQGAVLAGQPASFGPVVWNRPTALSVKSEP